jgi:ribonuclease-3
MMKKRLEELEEAIGYQFKNKALLKTAITHSSYANDVKKSNIQDNERLEFLGDAVLELSSSDVLFQLYEDKKEGELTRLRASIVCEPTLAQCAREIDLGSYLLLSRGEEQTGGRERESVTSDAFEALIGAIYLDGGFDCAKQFVEKFVLNDIEKKQLFYDSKTILQEILQKNYKERVDYVLKNVYGPDHNKHFVVDAVFRGEVMGSGEGRTKKRAEQQAAYEALLKLQSETDKEN